MEGRSINEIMKDITTCLSVIDNLSSKVSDKNLLGGIKECKTGLSSILYDALHGKINKDGFKFENDKSELYLSSIKNMADALNEDEKNFLAKPIKEAVTQLKMLKDELIVEIAKNELANKFSVEKDSVQGIFNSDRALWMLMGRAKQGLGSYPGAKENLDNMFNGIDIEMLKRLKQQIEQSK